MDRQGALKGWVDRLRTASLRRRFNARGARVIALLALSAMTTGCDGADAAAEAPPAVVYGMNRIAFQSAKLPTITLPSGGTRQIGSVLNVGKTMDYGDYLWDEAGVPPGKVWILVDLKAQTMSVFKGKHEIGTAVTLYGVDEKPTPVGRFTVLQKMKDHWSSSYDAPMPYTLRLTNDGIAIHGSDVRAGAGTHGCLGVPLEFGSRLFSQVSVADEVVIMDDASRIHAPAELN